MKHREGVKVIEERLTERLDPREEKTYFEFNQLIKTKRQTLKPINLQRNR